MSADMQVVPDRLLITGTRQIGRPYRRGATGREWSGRRK